MANSLIIPPETVAGGSLRQLLLHLAYQCRGDSFLRSTNRDSVHLQSLATFH